MAEQLVDNLVINSQSPVGQAVVPVTCTERDMCLCPGQRAATRSSPRRLTEGAGVEGSRGKTQAHVSASAGKYGNGSVFVILNVLLLSINHLLSFYKLFM